MSTIGSVGRTQTIVQLSDELLEELDAEATARGMSRSALIRLAIDGLLAASREAAITRAIVEGYTRIPPGTPDEWGSLEELADEGTRELLERLDAEERAAGLPPW